MADFRSKSAIPEAGQTEGSGVGRNPLEIEFLANLATYSMLMLFFTGRDDGYLATRKSVRPEVALIVVQNRFTLSNIFSRLNAYPLVA